MKEQTYKQQGFALPVVLLTSMMLIVVMLALSQSIMSMRNSVNYSYYSQLAEESSEAGTIYAAACIDANGRAQTWNNTTKPLNQSSDCDGNQNVYAASTTGGTNASIPIHFSVGNISVTPFSVDIPAQGTATTPGSSSTITGNANRAITWSTDTTAQKSVSGTERTCGILSGNVYCWGSNAYGQLGNGTTIDSLTPVKVMKESGVLAGKQVTDMFAAQWHNCALSAGEVYCWGRNNRGQLGDGTTTNRSKPVKVGGLLAGKTVTAVGGTYDSSCAIAIGKIYCWGYNQYGTVGANTTTTSYSTPTAVATVANGLPSTYTATALTSGSRSVNMCAIADGLAYCWGENNAGQIGNNTAPSATIYRAPLAVYTAGVLSGKTVTAISQDGYSSAMTSTPPFSHVCVIANSALYCWGENNSGQLGNNSTTDSRVPVAVSTSGLLSGKTIVSVISGIPHSCALSSLGKVYCWGGNSSGQIGDNTSSTRTTPVSVYEQAGALLGATVTTIGGGANRGCATANGKSYCWGLNSNGQIGDGTTTTRYKPTESLFLRPQNNNYIY